MSWIDSISHEQKGKIPHYVDKWKNIALSTTPTDRGNAKLAIEELYLKTGREKPESIIVLESPGACLYAELEFATDHLRAFKNVTPSDVARVANQKNRLKKYFMSNRAIDISNQDTQLNLPDANAGSVNVGSEIAFFFIWRPHDYGMFFLPELERELWSGREEMGPYFLKLEDMLSGIDSCLYRTIWRFMTAYDHLTPRCPNRNTRLLKNHTSMIEQAAWLCYCEFYKDVIGANTLDQFMPLIEVAKECSWLLPYENICFASAKPTAIHTDEQGRLHRYGGPAIEYGDGWGAWAINGIATPEKYGIQEFPQESNGN